MKIKSKVWLEINGNLVFGSGKLRILKAVHETGSINKAAERLHMSYRHAWSYIRTAEQRLGKPLLIKTKGGKGGGGAELTEYAKDLIHKFDKIEREINDFADKRYKEIFLHVK